MNKLKIIEDAKKVEVKFNKSKYPHVIIDFDNYNFTIGKKTYKSNKSLKAFHNSNDYIRFIVGPYGSGKSSASCAEIMFRSVCMPACKDGIRRSKWMIVRNTSGELETTTLQTWLHWFDDLGSISSRKKPIMDYKHTFRDDKGIVELELLFLALDRPDDIKKLKSLEITGAYLNELSELPGEILSHIKTRTNRYPSSTMISKPYWSGIIADSNPPDIDSWIYRLFEVEKPEGYATFKQPPGVLDDDNGGYISNEDADNLENLTNQNYYIDMARGETREFVNVYCKGDYGTVIHGRKVYENYNDDLHAQLGLEAESNQQLILGWDFGLTPACLIAQLTSSGRIIVLKEFCTDYMSVRELAENCVCNYLNSKYKGYAYLSVGDPSDRPSDSTKQSCMMILQECGIYTVKAQTNDIIPRIDAVKQYLSKLIDGRPALIISKDQCPVLRKGFLGKYNYKRLRILGEEKYRDLPDKTHPYSDIQDCLQYICLNYCYENKSSETLTNFYEATPEWC